MPHIADTIHTELDGVLAVTFATRAVPRTPVLLSRPFFIPGTGRQHINSQVIAVLISADYGGPALNDGDVDPQQGTG